MKHFFFVFGCCLLLNSCSFKAAEKPISIDQEQLLSNLQALSDDSYEGRAFSSPGNIRAQKFLAEQFERIGVEPAFSSGYIQKFEHTFKGRMRQRLFPFNDKTAAANGSIPDTSVYGGNVAAVIRGKTRKVIVITAHLDHLGIKNGKIYNGADDDASGTAALISMAAYFKNKKPRHTLLFAAVDAEEIGSLGCQYMVDHFPGGLENVVMNINMDMIAHNDSLELYASGLYHYPNLKKPLEKITSPISLLYGHDNPENKALDDWTFSSDHRVFHKKKIPFVYFGVEDHKDYHKPTDTFENINQEFYTEAVKLIARAIEGYDAYLNN